MRRQPKSLLLPENYKLYLALTWWPVNIYCTASQNGAIPHIYPSIETTSKACLLIVIGNSVPIFAKKKQKWWSQTKKHATYGPGLRFVFLFYIRTVRFQTRTKVTRVWSATEMKSDRSEFIFRPVPCKRMPQKKCMETDINSYRSEIVPVGRRS